MQMIVNYVIGVLFGCILIAAILVQSNGLEPSGICNIVNGNDGLLPLNPNEGGATQYSCDPNFLSGFMYACFAAVIITPFLMLIAWGKSFLISR